MLSTVLKIITIILPLNLFGNNCVSLVNNIAELDGYNVIDFRNKKIIDSPSMIHAYNYFNYVKTVYTQRLNLSDQEISLFVKSSIDSIDRTILITSACNNCINSGVAVVYSKSKDELLPFEKFIGTSFRSEDKSIEITRLVSRHGSKKILRAIASILKANNDHGSVYVVTSRAHYAIYKKLQVPGTETQMLGRDILLKFTVNDYVNALPGEDG